MPGDKSISHRALICGALSTRQTTIKGLLESEDVLRTAQVLSQLGADISQDAGTWYVRGRGVGGLRQPTKALDFGNSGTGARLLMGVVAGHQITAEFTGDSSLCRRPMARVLKPLQEMGLNIEQSKRQSGTDSQTLPLTLRGTPNLIPIRYTLPVPSAQVKSAVLLAGLHAPGKTTVIESTPTRDHTERMLRHFGADVAATSANGTTEITVTGDAELTGRDVVVPGDPSSAAFLTAAALIVPGSNLTIEGVLINPTRTGFFETVQEMGADLSFDNQREEAGEPVADLTIRASELQGVTVPPERAPSMIDEYPILAVLAAFAKGETRMEGLSELKVKESDRLSATAAGLCANGVKAHVENDTLIVHGDGNAVPGGGMVATHLDHRMAMSFLVMGLASKLPVVVDDTSMIATSFPNFADVFSALGVEFETLTDADHDTGAPP